MLRRLGVILLWTLATLGTASLTYAAVSQAGGATGDVPAPPVASAEIAARVSTTTTVAPGSTTTVVTEATTTTIPAATTSTTVLTTSTIAATTTVAPTTTTTSAAHTEWKTVTGVGSVAVSVSGNTVSFVAAQPVAPFGVSVEESGPQRVEVKFEAEDVEWRVRAEAEGGVVRWDVESDDD